MQAAIAEARATLAEGGLPYGAALVRGQNVIGLGRNLAIQHNDPTSHAEMEAIRAAGLQDTYGGTVMYATAFPCLMCAGAIVKLGIPKIVVGATWPGHEISRAFLQSHGVELAILELKACQELLPIR
jgi:creatinine deaminase